MTNFPKIRTLIPLVLLAIFLLVPASAEAQRKFDVAGWLKKRDKNNSGSIEPNELNESDRRFIEKNIGLNPDGVISISAAVSKIQGDRNELEKEKEDEEFAAIPWKIPGFGEPVTREDLPGFGMPDDEKDDLPRIPGFELTEDQVFESMVSIRDQFGKRINDQVDGLFRSYDKDKSGFIDGDEIGKVPWDRTPWKENDENNDAKLSKVEIAKRYKARAGGRDDRDDDRGNERNRGGGRRTRERPKTTEKKTEAKPASTKNNTKRTTDYVKSTIKEHDSNGNGKLDGDEIAGIGIMKKADFDGDGEITYDELIAHTTGKKPGSDANESTTSRQGTGDSRRSGQKRRTSGGSRRGTNDDEPEDRIMRDLKTTDTVKNSDDARKPANDEAIKNRRVRVPTDFSRKDKDADGNISLTEFNSTITEESINEFQKLDQNGDGVITPIEWNNK